MKISFIVQARTGSSRLPNKIMLPFFEGKSILELLIEKLRKVPDTQIIIATSVSPANDVIEDLCSVLGVHCFRGNETDVLQRFIDAAEKFGAEKLIRVCSDNPFLELDSIIKLVNTASSSDADYISFNIDNVPSIKTHYGFWTEYTTLNALKKVKQLTNDGLFHEHVTNYIYSHPDTFSAEWISGPVCLNNRKDIRLTCDTIEDFNCLKAIYADICKSKLYPTIREVVAYLDQHVEYLDKMVEQIKSNSK